MAVLLTKPRPSEAQEGRVETGQVNVCCVFLCQDWQGRLLLHRRSGLARDERGTWDCGAGRLEFGEDPIEAVEREISEEYGAHAENVSLLGVRNVLRPNGPMLTHWVALIFRASVDPDEVRVGEPSKMSDLGWYTLDNLPQPRHSQLDFYISLLGETQGGSIVRQAPQRLLTSLRYLRRAFRRERRRHVLPRQAQVETRST